MKKIMKKVSTLKGVILTPQDALDFLDGTECSFDDDVWYVDCGQKITIKVNGKIVENDNVKIYLEGQ